MSGPRLLSWIAVALAVGCAALVRVADTDTEAAHLVIRWTARSSLVLFLLAYVARPLVALRPTAVTKSLLARRKWIGLGFALSHLAHLGGIVALASPDPAAFVRAQVPTTAVAALAFVVLFAMAITSIDAVRARMSGRAWKRLHRFGMHFLMIPFVTTYVGAIAVSPVYVVPALATVLAIGVRVTAWRRTSRSRARPA